MNHCKAMVLILAATFAFLPVISSAQMTWTCATDSAGWSRRGAHASVVFDGKMWVMGGRFHASSTDSVLNDVWWSTNGTDWTLATDSAPWSRRMGHGVVVFQDTMWLMGGWGVGTVLLNDVWYSTDGVNWICADSSADWSGRSFFGATVYNDEIWIMGGLTVVGAVVVNDVWSSPNGVNWTCVDSAADWSRRCNHKVSNFDGKIWVVAGYDGIHFNDVWYSTDCSSWVCAIDTAQWFARRAHTTIVFDNKMWLMGGLIMGGRTAPVCLNDVWYSTDGSNWYCADSAADWQPRCWHTSVVYNNNLWVIGGLLDSGRVNDVWYSSGLGIEEDNISIAEEPYLGSTIVKGPLQLPEDKECIVFDITGRIVEPDRIAPGVYFVEIDNKVVQKVVKIR